MSLDVVEELTMKKNYVVLFSRNVDQFAGEKNAG